jgi:cysteinyl-tRNA synthetase
MQTFVFDVLGLTDESEANAGGDVINGLMDLILDIRKSARENKDWVTSDKIRDQLKAAGVEIKDTKDGVEWRI